MVDAPERIWAHLDIDGPRIEPERMKEIIERKTFLYTEAFMFPGTLLDLLKDAEALRAELEQVKRDDYRAAYKREPDGRIAAERLAGARVVDREAIAMAVAGYTDTEKWANWRDNHSTYPNRYKSEIDRVYTITDRILSALAEPAGEAEPVAWMRRWAHDSIDVMAMKKADRPPGWQLHAVTAVRCLPDDVPLYTTTPDASAIREALVEIANGCSGRVDRDHLACRIASATLAGAKP